MLGRKLVSGVAGPRLAPPVLRRPVVVARASDDVPRTAMSEIDALSTLGLEAGKRHEFDSVIAAKNKALAAKAHAPEVVEAAYDVLFSLSMKRRLSGETDVSTSVRYADVPPPTKRGAASPQRGAASPSSKTLPKLPTSLPNGLSVGVNTKVNSTVATQQAAVFAGLAAWGILQACLETPEAQLSDTGSFQLALGLGYSIYSLQTTKRMPIGKAVGVSAVAVIAGAILGSAINTYVRPDIVPIGAFASPGMFVTEFILVLLGSACVFVV